MAGDVQDRLAWLVDRIGDRGVGLTADELAEHLVPREGRDLEQLRSGFDMWSDRIGQPMEVESQTWSDDGLSGIVVVAGAKERRWEVAATVDPESFRLQRYTIERCLPEGIELRVAGPDDTAALAELYRSIPMVAGDLEVTIDVGDDYFVMTRLMPESRTLIATDHGQPVGLYTGTRFPSTLNGREVMVILGCHTRIAAGKAGGGLWSRMNRLLVDHFAEDGFDVALVYVLTGNTAASRLTTVGAWPSGPLRAVVPCVAGSDAPAVRRATAGDADEVSSILNATHTGHDLFLPYTAATLRARLERAPDVYGWDDLWIGDGAVLGVGRHLHRRVTKPATDRPVESVRAVTYDYGFLPGRENAFVDLVSARGAALAAAGATHLGVFTCEPAAAFSILSELAESLESYDLLAPNAVPDDAASARGVYVDASVF